MHSFIVTVVSITGTITENLSQRTFVNRASGSRVVSMAIDRPASGDSRLLISHQLGQIIPGKPDPSGT